MFSYVWKTGNPIETPSFEGRFQVQGKMPFLWLEHCVECAAPLCYKSCEIYQQRIDGRCLRFENGVHPIRFDDGSIGAQLSFRRWAKMESKIGNNIYAVDERRLYILGSLFNNFGVLCNKLLKSLRISWHKHRPNKVIESVLSIILGSKKWSEQMPIDGFLVSVYNHRPTMCTMLMEITDGNKSIYKHAFVLKPSWNEEFLPIAQIPINLSRGQLIKIYLEDNEQGTFTFKNLDFVSLLSLSKNISSPASKVKCVAWDLDNTLWDGVIGDTDNGNVTLKPDSVKLIKELDQRGILQTIVSKNTFDIAWAKINEFGIQEYFLYPAINWGRKSQNMVSIANELNINIDTFAFIDDSVFERNEVATSLPQVRTYDVQEIPDLLSKPEFNLPITIESAKRRESYLIDRERKSIKASYGNDYDSFLRDCMMHMKMFRPSNQEDKERCIELLQRSNQYNISKDKRDRDGFEQIVSDKNYQLYAIQVYDKFGDYGIVGFASIQQTAMKRYEIRDFVMSCRVAQKKVERAFFNELFYKFKTDDTIVINLYKTSRNKPLQDELKCMPFVITENDEYLECSFIIGSSSFCEDNIIKVDANE